MSDFSRTEISAVLLFFAGKAMHYNEDLNYIVEVVRNVPSAATPWNTLSTHLKHSNEAFRKSEKRGYWELIDYSKDFVIKYVGEEEYNAITALLKQKGFIGEDGKLQWTPHCNYRHEVFR